MRTYHLAVVYFSLAVLCPAMITSFVSTRSTSTFRARKPSYRKVCQPLEDLISREQIQALSDGQTIVVDGVFHPDFAKELASDVASIDSSCFAMHTTGSSPSTQKVYSFSGQRIRGDLAGWFDNRGSLNSATTLESLRLLWRYFDYLRVFLNEENSSGVPPLKRQDCQLARFPGDGKSAYPKHIDAFQDKQGANRQITAIVYLNNGWVKEDGGCLRVWHGNRAMDIAPALNRLVLFRSSSLAHEVLPSFKARHAASVWFYDGGVPYNSSVNSLLL